MSTRTPVRGRACFCDRIRSTILKMICRRRRAVYNCNVVRVTSASALEHCMDSPTRVCLRSARLPSRPQARRAQPPPRLRRVRFLTPQTSRDFPKSNLPPTPPHSTTPVIPARFVLCVEARERFECPQTSYAHDCPMDSGTTRAFTHSFALQPSQHVHSRLASRQRRPNLVVSSLGSVRTQKPIPTSSLTKRNPTVLQQEPQATATQANLSFRPSGFGGCPAASVRSRLRKEELHTQSLLESQSLNPPRSCR